MAYAGDLTVDPTDEVFMRAVEVVDRLGRQKRTYTCQVEVARKVPKAGWKGAVLRQKEQVLHYVDGWDLGEYSSGGIVRLALTADGVLCFSQYYNVGGNGRDQMFVFTKAVALEHHHFHGQFQCESIARVLDQLAVAG
jgi:hypothetical protein